MFGLVAHNRLEITSKEVTDEVDRDVTGDYGSCALKKFVEDGRKGD